MQLLLLKNRYFIEKLKKHYGFTVKKEVLETKKQPWNGKEFSAEITLPPLAISVFQIKA
tara:strand:- start:9434 stop:9610 length:177 start_codon:yes stop_codon:yes gene_type:complete